VLDARTAGLTLVALVAFASNSLLTRLALGAQQIDAATFTALRLGAGTLALALVVRVSAVGRPRRRERGLLGPLSLFAYALPFSFAYVRIGAATGALVLFAAVQLTMIGFGLARGERPPLLGWFGIALALAGLLLLTLPAASRPDPLGVGLMLLAGVAWGAYSLAGRSAPDPIAANARNFLWASIPALLVVVFVALQGGVAATERGLGLALACGALTSGMGYAVWYRVLPRLSVLQASVSQLSVPVIAALAAVAWLDERASSRLLIAGVAVLSGVGLVLSARQRAPRRPT
jgi:drug/metabolite transporter (DMT)-like permease